MFGYLCLIVLYSIMMYYHDLHSLSSLYSSTNPVVARRNPFQYVYDTYRRNATTEVKFASNDTEFKPLTYQLKQNMKWNHHSVCTKDTFVLLMYFTCRSELERRNLIRQHVKQGMIIDGMIVNYVMIVAAGANETSALDELARENDEYSDLLISLHEDTYFNWPITVLDAYMWVRDYCKQASYVVKIDGDTWVHLGNLVHYLLDAPRKRFYGGLPKTEFFNAGKRYKRIQYHPMDSPGKWITFNFGACNVVSRDVVPFVNIGTQFMDYLWPVCEDSLIADILRRAGIVPYGKPRLFHWMLFNNNWLNGTIIPSNTISVHTRRDNQLLIALYREYGINSTIHDAT